MRKACGSSLTGCREITPCAQAIVRSHPGARRCPQPEQWEKTEEEDCGASSDTPRRASESERIRHQGRASAKKSFFECMDKFAEMPVCLPRRDDTRLHPKKKKGDDVDHAITLFSPALSVIITVTAEIEGQGKRQKGQKETFLPFFASFLLLCHLD
ncbi:MAG: hypothetical protein ACREEM_28760 [Blastocatellia bacterium]